MIGKSLRGEIKWAFGTEQELSWPRDFIGAIPLAISQVQLLAARLIQQGIKLEVVDGVTTTDSEAELAEVKQMDTLMYPFLKNSGFFWEVSNGYSTAWIF